VVEGFAFMLVLQDVTLSAGTQVAALCVGTRLGAGARWGTFIQVLAKGRILWIDDFTGWTGA
jgi:hypothetical protein